jgi:hypothetical protein
MAHAYDSNNTDIRVKIDGTWSPANSQQKEAYIAYKSRYHYYRETLYTHDNGITIFRDGRNDVGGDHYDPYMPTYFKLDGSVRNANAKYPIIDMNDIYIFLMEGVTGIRSRNGAGWVKSRDYQAWAYIDFVYDTNASRKCYMSKYSTYLAFPPGFDSSNVVTIDIDDLPPNIIFSMSRNDNNSVYYEKNDRLATRIRICDNEYARIGFLGFFTRITMDTGIIITPPSAATHANANIFEGVLPTLIETGDEDEQCILCYKYKKNIKYEPCNHIISCYECVEKLVKKECPVCKSKIVKVKNTE